MSYQQKARLLFDVSEIDQYRPILDKDEFRSDELHWNSISKNAITLFQVLIDLDLRHLVMVLQMYPRYTPLVCEHFRYAYSYSENEADIDAASELLRLGEAYFTKQFVRNVIRKLPKVDQYDLSELKAFAQTVEQYAMQWHPIVVQHYSEAVKERLEALQIHPLQKIVVLKVLETVKVDQPYDYGAQDRDSTLDIPYMT